MGGQGSGATGWKPKSEQSCKIDVRSMNKNGMLKAGVSSRWSWSNANEPLGEVTITSLGSKLIIEQKNRHSAQYISLTWTACNYGGQRPWLLCPVCKRRSAILYLFSGDFSCSHCNDITYYSRCESPLDRLLRKKRKILKLITIEDGWDIGFFSRSKGMHQKTFNRLIDEYSEIENSIENKINLNG